MHGMPSLARIVYSTMAQFVHGSSKYRLSDAEVDEHPTRLDYFVINFSAFEDPAKAKIMEMWTIVPTKHIGAVNMAPVCLWNLGCPAYETSFSIWVIDYAASFKTSPLRNIIG
jgi:hypothetical protein